MGLNQAVEGLNRTKGRVRQHLFSLGLPVFELGHQFSPDFRLDLKLKLGPFASQALGLRLELYHQLFCIPAYHLQILGLFGLHNHVHQFLLSQSLDIDVSPIGSVSAENLDWHKAMTVELVRTGQVLDLYPRRGWEDWLINWMWRERERSQGWVKGFPWSNERKEVP